MRPGGNAVPHTIAARRGAVDRTGGRRPGSFASPAAPGAPALRPGPSTSASRPATRARATTQGWGGPPSPARPSRRLSPGCVPGRPAARDRGGEAGRLWWDVTATAEPARHGRCHRTRPRRRDGARTGAATAPPAHLRTTRRRPATPASGTKDERPRRGTDFRPVRTTPGLRTNADSRRSRDPRHRAHGLEACVMPGPHRGTRSER